MNIIRSKLKIILWSGAVPALNVLMEVSWVYGWLVWFSTMPFLRSPGEPILSFFGSLVFTILIAIIYRYLIKRNISITKIRAIVIGCAVFLIIILIRMNVTRTFNFFDSSWFAYAGFFIPQIISIAFFLAYLTWRGISIGQRNSSYDGLYRSFSIGLAGTVFCLMISGFSGQMNILWSDIGIYTVVFFCSGILMLSLANLKHLADHFSRHKETSSSFIQRWIPILFIFVLVILGVSIVITGIFFTDTAAIVLQQINKGLDWLSDMIIYILYPIGYIVAVLIWIGDFIVSLISAPDAELFDVQSALKNAFDFDPSTKDPSAGIPQEIMITIKVLAAVLIIFLVGLFLVRSMRRQYRGKLEDDVYEENESLWSWPGFKRDISMFFSWLFGWMRRKTTGSLKVNSTALTEELNIENEQDAANIREIYQRFLIKGRRIGLPRYPSETPYEYSRRVQRVLNTNIEEIDNITGLYVYERYGEIPVKQEKMNLINRLWKALREKLSEISGR